DLRHPARLRRAPEPAQPRHGGRRMRGRGRTGEPSHITLHVFLVLFTLLALYPLLWVVAIAFSGEQSLAIASLPRNPGTLDRLRAVLPWPHHWSVVNFTSVLTEQPFSRWLWNSAVV